MDFSNYILHTIIIVALCICWFYLGRRSYKKKPGRFDGNIEVDGYDLKGLTLEIDIPDIAQKSYLVIEIRHVDKS